MNNAMLKTILLVAIIFITFPVSSQEIMTFTLEEAKQYGVDNFYSTKNARLDLEIADEQIWQTTAIGLPQITGSIQYQNMLDIPTQLMPDFISPAVYGVLMAEGVPIDPTHIPDPNNPAMFPVQFGTPHNASWSVSVSQLIFSGEYIIGLQAAKVFRQFSEKSLVATEQEVKMSVAQTYSMVLMMDEAITNVNDNLAEMEKILAETEKLVQAGFLEETNLDQMRLNVNNLKIARDKLLLDKNAVNRLMCFQLGLPYDSKVELKDDMNTIFAQVQSSDISTQQFSPSNHIKYQQIEVNEQLSLLSLRREKVKQLPSLFAFANYQRNAMRNEFDFFDFNKEWYPTTVIGLQIDIPIWKSWGQQSVIQQRSLEMQKSSNMKMQVEIALRLEVETAQNEYKNAAMQYEAQMQNKDLAEKIYSRTKQKYEQGMASGMELTQANTQYLSALSNINSAKYNLVNAFFKLQKAMGEI